MDIKWFGKPHTNQSSQRGEGGVGSLVCECLVSGAFFTRGSGIFHGILNLLSSISIVESCVLPCFLSGAEAWILNCSLLQKLESFQAEFAKRILRLSKHTSNNVALIALQWPSIRARVLSIKLCFLQKIAKNDYSLSSCVFQSLTWNLFLL